MQKMQGSLQGNLLRTSHVWFFLNFVMKVIHINPTLLLLLSFLLDLWANTVLWLLWDECLGWGHFKVSGPSVEITDSKLMFDGWLTDTVDHLEATWRVAYFTNMASFWGFGKLDFPKFKLVTGVHITSHENSDTIHREQHPEGLSIPYSCNQKYSTPIAH